MHFHRSIRQVCPIRETQSDRESEQGEYVVEQIIFVTTFSNGCLGSHYDEERSEMRYVMRIARPRESQNFSTHIALSGFSREYACLSVWRLSLIHLVWELCVNVGSAQVFSAREAVWQTKQGHFGKDYVVCRKFMLRKISNKFEPKWLFLFITA